MRQILAGTAISETELHDFRARDSELPAQFGHFWRDVAEILSNERQVAERVSQGIEEVFIGPLHPMPVNRSRFVGGYLPVGLKPAKMIEAHDVAGLNRPTHSLNPPLVAVRLERIPVV